MTGVGMDFGLRQSDSEGRIIDVWDCENDNGGKITT